MTRIIALVAATAALFPLSARADATCSDGRAICEAVCTPAHIARYYFGRAAHCTASCEPRWQQCMRTGIWVHLEDRYPGWHQPVSRY